MRISVHQPIFLPWPGFFYKAIKSDCVVLLDDVQFPRGKTWLTRNRLKNEDGTLWLIVPVWRKGKGYQIIREVEIYNGRHWRRKHLGSIRQNYVNSPYFEDFFKVIESIYKKNHIFLAEFNIELIRFINEELSIETEFLLQSKLGIKGKGTELLINICNHLEADRLSIFPGVKKHIDTESMEQHGIELAFVKFQPPVYPQLRGEFIYNLSTLDMLFNCGPRSRKIISE